MAAKLSELNDFASEASSLDQALETRHQKEVWPRLMCGVALLWSIESEMRVPRL